MKGESGRIKNCSYKMKKKMINYFFPFTLLRRINYSNKMRKIINYILILLIDK